jgi:predicted permease
VALGASPARIGRQLLADSLLVALAGGLLGVALAPAALRAFIGLLPRDVAAHALRSTVDARLLSFACLVSVGAGLLSGLAPALHAGRKSLIASLRERDGALFGGTRLRKVIVTGQVAFSLILVIGAVLFVRTLTGLLAKGPGFDTSSLVSFGLQPLKNGYTAGDANRLIRRVYEEIEASAVAQTSAVARMPLLTGGTWSNPMTIQTERRVVADRDVNVNAVTPGFFRTLGVRMVAGRDFDQRDSRPVGEGGPRSAIVNEAFVKRYLDGRSPLGVHVGEGAGPDVRPDIEVVGVVADFNYRGLREEWEQVYFPLFERDHSSGTFYVKVRGAPEQALRTIRAIVDEADPTLPITGFRTLDEQIDRSLNTERILATLSGSFGLLALLLSLIGIYGVMSFLVTQRTRELGLRIALGATGASAIRLVLRDALVMIATGIAIALPCVAALGRLVRSQLFGVTPTDPISIAQATVVLALAAVAAAFVPAHRASRVDPNEALHLE